MSCFEYWESTTSSTDCGLGVSLEKTALLPIHASIWHYSGFRGNCGKPMIAQDLPEGS